MSGYQIVTHVEDVPGLTENPTTFAPPVEVDAPTGKKVVCGYVKSEELVTDGRIGYSASAGQLGPDGDSFLFSMPPQPPKWVPDGPMEQGNTIRYTAQLVCVDA